MSRKIRLTEGDLKNIVKESVMRVLNKGTKAMNEATNGGWTVETNEVEEAYQMLAAILGEDAANAAIVRCLDEVSLSQCLAYLLRMYNVQEWSKRDI